MIHDRFQAITCVCFISKICPDSRSFARRVKYIISYIFQNIAGTTTGQWSVLKPEIENKISVNLWNTILLLHKLHSFTILMRFMIISWRGSWRWYVTSSAELVVMRRNIKKVTLELSVVDARDTAGHSTVVSNLTVLWAISKWKSKQEVCKNYWSYSTQILVFFPSTLVRLF